MKNSKNRTIARRFTFTIPPSDVQLIEWVETQYSVSASIRALIKDYIAKHGVTDTACGPITTVKSDSSVEPVVPVMQEVVVSETPVQKSANKAVEQHEEKTVQQNDTETTETTDSDSENSENNGGNNSSVADMIASMMG